jgi:hypothetical protein
VLVGAGVFVLSGCGSGHSVPPAPHPYPHPAGATRTSSADLLGRPQGAVLRLSHGHSTARFRITALPPPQHTWDVGITAPARADFAVHILTWYGAWLGVLDTRDRFEPECVISDTRRVCRLHFPQLEAQRAGPWTVIATERSKREATVRIQVTFNRTGSG